MCHDSETLLAAWFETGEPATDEATDGRMDERTDQKTIYTPTKLKSFSIKKQFQLVGFTCTSAKYTYIVANLSDSAGHRKDKSGKN